MISFLSLLVISFMLTTLLGVKSYNILTLTVSRLGSSHFSPVPILFDIACILAGTITIPYNLLITKNSLSYVSKDKNKRLKCHLSFLISRFGLTTGILGGIGYIFVGIFSLERSGSNGLYHGFFSGYLSWII